MEKWEERDNFLEREQFLKRDQLLKGRLPTEEGGIRFIKAINERIDYDDKVEIYYRCGAACLEMIYSYYDPDNDFNQLEIHEDIEIISYEDINEIFDETGNLITFCNEYHETDVEHITHHLHMDKFILEIIQFSDNPIEILKECTRNNWQVLFFTQIQLDNRIHKHFTVFKSIDENHIFYHDPEEEEEVSTVPIKSYLNLSKLNENLNQSQLTNDVKIGSILIVLKGRRI